MISAASDGLYWCGNGGGDRGILGWYLHRISVSQDIHDCDGMAMAVQIHWADATYMDKMSHPMDSTAILGGYRHSWYCITHPIIKHLLTVYTIP